jgi:deoxyribonuclease-1
MAPFGRHNFRQPQDRFIGHPMSPSPFAVSRYARVAMRCLCLLLLLTPAAHAQPPSAVDRGNQRIVNFDHAKAQLRILYAEHPMTLYSNCAYDAQLAIDYSRCAYVPKKDNARAHRVEWEHVVPAEAFGQNFIAWRNGDPNCIDSQGRLYKGRRCAQKISPAYRRMEGDLYNLYPEIGELNQIRSNHPMDVIEDDDATLAPLSARSSRKAFMPPAEVLGDVARTYLYMQDAYPGLRVVSARRRKLYLAWSAQDPVDAWECRRAWRIAAIQGNTNRIVQRACMARDLWPKLQVVPTTTDTPLLPTGAAIIPPRIAPVHALVARPVLPLPAIATPTPPSAPRLE